MSLVALRRWIIHIAMAENEWIELFVPGRICLFGEHSDWAGGFRRFNEKIEPGATIVVGTNQGIFARVRRSPKLVLRSVDYTGHEQKGEIDMSPRALLAEAIQPPQNLIPENRQ